MGSVNAKDVRRILGKAFGVSPENIDAKEEDPFAVACREYRQALRRHWPEEKPWEIAQLHRILDSLGFTAPEMMYLRVRDAQQILYATKDDEVRIALLYFLAMMNVESVGRAREVSR